MKNVLHVWLRTLEPKKVKIKLFLQKSKKEI